MSLENWMRTVVSGGTSVSSGSGALKMTSGGGPRRAATRGRGRGVAGGSARASSAASIRTMPARDSTRPVTRSQRPVSMRAWTSSSNPSPFGSLPTTHTAASTDASTKSQRLRPAGRGRSPYRLRPRKRPVTVTARSRYAAGSSASVRSVTAGVPVTPRVSDAASTSSSPTPGQGLPRSESESRANGRPPRARIVRLEPAHVVESSRHLETLGRAGRRRRHVECHQALLAVDQVREHPVAHRVGLHDHFLAVEEDGGAGQRGEGRGAPARALGVARPRERPGRDDDDPEGDRGPPESAHRQAPCCKSQPGRILARGARPCALTGGGREP